ncbi:hypothetical protein WJX81_002705 [Elliptochloris bilobata]|uniref:Uncharacterized protein n=1 Tax=Elliptochloris bilobata TaxID=381761 RepID=A0AAW1RY33_9CHLO
MQTDWTPQGARGPLHSKVGAPSASELREGAKDKLIYDLSLSNERLESDNMRLRQHVLDLRRAARAAGCDLDASEALSAAAFPELEAALNQTAPNMRTPAGATTGPSIGMRAIGTPCRAWRSRGRTLLSRGRAAPPAASSGTASRRRGQAAEGLMA